jgi:hypothetical protein
MERRIFVLYTCDIVDGLAMANKKKPHPAAGEGFGGCCLAVDHAWC